MWFSTQSGIILTLPANYVPKAFNKGIKLLLGYVTTKVTELFDGMGHPPVMDEGTPERKWYFVGGRHCSWLPAGGKNSN